MRFSHRRTSVHCLAALAFGAAALTGCGGADDGRKSAAEPTAPATPSASPTPSASAAPSAPAGEEAPTTVPSAGSAPDGTPVPTEAAPWAGTKQFVQIEDAWTDDGRTHLSVRPARKEAMTQPHEAWVVVPGEGPYTTVPMAEDARVLLSVPLGDDSKASSYSQAEFVSRLKAQSSEVLPLVGYDLSFDGEGRVTRVRSLYTS
ncbi:hypothetical protein [Streptomyces pini]|uniref:Lipoprotein n=1 Tax=Streptomyces pini TaxID=1520580 RepID=A0A1I4FGM6_9ACTN|nr:hypothetical protein [Streptomyces pini]SFL16450.1 hypothetical protein SAMN05192584_11414 [Streptomyces pini]